MNRFIHLIFFGLLGLLVLFTSSASAKCNYNTPCKCPKGAKAGLYCGFELKSK